MNAKKIDYKTISLKTPVDKLTTELEILRKKTIENAEKLGADDKYVERDCKVVKILCDTFNGIYDTAFSNCTFIEKKLIIKFLNNIFNGRPLSPLENNEDDWEEDEYKDGTFYHKRYHSLWKIPDGNGGFRYSDRKRVIGCERNSKYHSEMLTEIIDQENPITFPYMPDSEPFIVRTMSFNSGKGETTQLRKFDYLEVRDYGIPRTGYWHWVPIERYFNWDSEGNRREITRTEYNAAMAQWVESMRKENDEAEAKEKEGL